MISEQNGSLVWFHPVPKDDSATNFQVQQYEGKPVLTWWQGRILEVGFGQGEDQIYDTSYRHVATVRAGNGYHADLHEIRLTPEGTAWIDEQDRMLVKGEGRFLNDFKVGGGILADIKKGTNFSFEQRKVNDEVWLPAKVEGVGGVRALLFFGFNGNLRVVESDYKKFKATSTILPGVSTAEPETNPQ